MDDGRARKRKTGAASAPKEADTKAALDKANRTKSIADSPQASKKSDRSTLRMVLKAFFALVSIVCLGVALAPYVMEEEMGMASPLLHSLLRVRHWSRGQTSLRPSPAREHHSPSPLDRASIRSPDTPENPAMPSPRPLRQPVQRTQGKGMLGLGDAKGQHLGPALPFKLTKRGVPDRIDRTADVKKRDAVRQAFQDSWSSYMQNAFGADDYHPMANKGSNFSSDGGVGYFVIDVIDMLLITGDREGYERAREWVSDLTWHDKSGKFSVFETTIRTLGGLLSAHALCRPDGQDTLSKHTRQICSPGDDDMFLAKAVELAERLEPAFHANDLGLPEREINFRTGEVFSDVDNNNLISLAELATIQLEFKYLAHATGQQKWWTLAERPMEVVRQASLAPPSNGLLPILFHPTTGKPQMSTVRLGSRGDSYFEYLLKQFIQTNRTELVYLDMYQRAMGGIKTMLLRLSPKRKLLHTVEIQPFRDPRTGRPLFRPLPKQDHLVCFLGGSFMLGALHVQQAVPYKPGRSRTYPPLDHAGFSKLASEDWSIGHELTRTCVETYTATKTGLSPEIAMFRMEGDAYRGPETDWFIKKPNPAPPSGQLPRVQPVRKVEPLIDARSILRPETVESLFIAFHLTGDPQYREWGWQIFEAFQRVTRLPKRDDGTPAGYASIRDVDVAPDQVEFEDRMETFWLAETLKYLYLLFDDQNALRLDQWVLNTEAHPLPIFTPTFATTVD